METYYLNIKYLTYRLQFNDAFVFWQIYDKNERENRRGGNSRSGPDPFYVLPPNDTPYYR